MRYFILITAFLFVTVSSTAFASFEEGKAAYEEKDWFNAIRYLRPLAEHGDDRALVLLGNMYNDGSGVGTDHQKAMEHYTRALANDNHNAMLAIATMHAEGLSVDKDFETAFEWFTKAANYGNPAAQFLLGSVYMGGHPELPDLETDLVTSYMWYRITAEQDTLPEIGEVADEFSKRLIQQLSPAEIVEAEERAADWQPLSSTTATKGE